MVLTFYPEMYLPKGILLRNNVKKRDNIKHKKVVIGIPNIGLTNIQLIPIFDK